MVKLVILLPHGAKYSPSYIETYNDFLMNLEKLPGAKRKAVNSKARWANNRPGGWVMGCVPVKSGLI